MLEAHIVKPRREFVVDVTIRLESGEAVAIFGASGAGKSTVLSCIAGLDAPSDGYVRFNGRQFFPLSLALHKRKIGYLTQDANLFPHLTVAQNVRFGLSGDNQAKREWLAELCERFELAPVWRASAGNISGGQARKVSLARMLACRPPLVLLDEPFSGLDRHVVRELISNLSEWRDKLGFSMIVVDHQEHVLRRLCQRALVIERGQIIQEGSWDQLAARPESPLLANLLAPL